MTPYYWLFLFILLPAIYFSIKKEKLTRIGAFTGGLIAFFIFLGAGFTGIGMLGFFFFSGTLATSWKIITKESAGAAENNKGRRTAGQVIANGGVAGIAGLLSFFLHQHRELFQLMMAASLSSATADTLSSELGTVYGKRFYNILNFKPDKQGDNGVVSIEGTLIGIIGSLIIAIIYTVGFGWNSLFTLIIIAGTIGNLMDSILGATLERKHYIKNDTVNFGNTLFAALFALIIAILS